MTRVIDTGSGPVTTCSTRAGSLTGKVCASIPTPLQYAHLLPRAAAVVAEWKHARGFLDRGGYLDKMNELTHGNEELFAGLCELTTLIDRSERTTSAKPCQVKAPPSSNFRGVQRTRSGKRWQAIITHERKAHHLGVYDLEEDAGRAYDTAARRFKGDVAVLNFPGETVASKQKLEITPTRELVPCTMPTGSTAPEISSSRSISPAAAPHKMAAASKSSHVRRVASQNVAENKPHRENVRHIKRGLSPAAAAYSPAAARLKTGSRADSEICVSEATLRLMCRQSPLRQGARLRSSAGGQAYNQ